MPTVCILYGFCEGPMVARRFHRELQKAGYKIIKDASRADVIIGHSGGCFLVPEQVRAQRIIQVGIPFWPGRALADSIFRKFVSDLRSHHREGELRFWTRKTFWNLVYFWNMSANIRMLRGRARGTLWRYGKISTVARPELDTLCTPDCDLLPFTAQPKVVSVDRHHDELWRDPAPYLALLK